MKVVKLFFGLLIASVVMFAILPIVPVLFVDVVKITWAGMPIWAQVAVMLGVVVIGARVAWGLYRWLTHPFRVEK